MHDWPALVRARLTDLTVDPARAADIVDELAQHVAQHYAELVASGVGAPEALRRALAPLDDPARLSREIARADRPRRAAPVPPAADERWMAGWGHDLRYAFRTLRHAPGFALVAILTIALGIGATTTMFSVLHAVVLRPLPYAEPDRLVNVGDAKDGHTGTVGFATAVDWQDQTRSFEGMALVRTWTPTLVADGEPERIPGVRVAANFFSLLGVRPAIGRDFAAAEDRPDRWHVVLISDGLWRRRFGADPSIVGRTIRLNDTGYEVAGVLPRTFEPLISEHYYQRAEIWAPLGYAIGGDSACRSCQHLRAIARLKPGVTLASAERDVNRVQDDLRRRFPRDYAASTRIAVTSLAGELEGGIRPALTALMAAVVFVLLIACANVANLLLARISRRARDLSMRAALGASRSRLVRQLLFESAFVSLAGGLLGVAFSVVAVPLLVRLTPFVVARLDDARVDAGMVAFAVGLSAATTLCFGLLPALRATRGSLAAVPGGDNRRTASAPASAARRLLIAADVALAVVLLAGAGLMIRSVWRLAAVDPGFDPAGVLTLQISMNGARYADDAQVVSTGDAMLEKIRALPGVTAAALAGQVPLGGDFDTRAFHVEGRPATADDLPVERYSVTPDYFQAMRISLVRGRLLTDGDRAGSERVMLVGERTARLVWPGQDPVGQRVRFGSETSPFYTVVGIVGDVRHYDMALPPTPQFYVAQRQFTDSFLIVVVKTAADPGSLAGDVRRVIWSVAGDVPVYSVATLSELVGRSVGSRRFVMTLLELFGAAALLLTTVGIYSVISCSVSERTREIGVRSALGATRADIARLVLGSGLAVVAGGLAAGCAMAFGVTRYLQSSLFGISPADPLTFAAVIAALFGVALAAQALPAARAMRVDPSVALRQE
ncbi:MAG TPA: ABC transporter permease [Vicinamibacterales bacterium]|nr:ABC transporter permease [Vicinamibacterales bacterium]